LKTQILFSLFSAAACSLALVPDRARVYRRIAARARQMMGENTARGCHAARSPTSGTPAPRPAGTAKGFVKKAVELPGLFRKLDSNLEKCGMVLARAGLSRLRRTEAVNIRFGTPAAAGAISRKWARAVFRDDPAAGVAVWMGMTFDA
jgi:hypothetical protein